MGEGGTERDQKADEREAALDRREEALAERMEAAKDILADAEQRDEVADARDEGADDRERADDKEQFLAKGNKGGTDDTYGADLPARRSAALDRQHARGNRSASEQDRAALTKDAEDPEVP